VTARKRTKRIGYVDYSLDNFHAKVYLKLFRNELARRGFDVVAATAMKEKAGREWAEDNDVAYFDDARAMDAEVDYYAVLAPSNPKVHLELCRKVFPFGKPTYVDKTFAPSLAVARRIFALADKHKAPVQTTSALRYTNVQDHIAEIGGRARVRHMVAWGGGGTFAEYAIHPVELVVSSMGPKAERLMRRGTGKDSQLLVDFSGGRTAVVNVYMKAATPFAASVTTAKGTKLITVDSSAIFLNMASAMLDFFETAKPNIPRTESLMIRRILDAAENPKALKGFVRL